MCSTDSPDNAACHQGCSRQHTSALPWNVTAFPTIYLTCVTCMSDSWQKLPAALCNCIYCCWKMSKVREEQKFTWKVIWRHTLCRLKTLYAPGCNVPQCICIGLTCNVWTYAKYSHVADYRSTGRQGCILVILGCLVLVAAVIREAGRHEQCSND